MKELKFQNLTVLYDDETEYYKERMKKFKRIQSLVIAVSLIVLLASIVATAFADRFLVGLGAIIILIVIDIKIMVKLVDKFVPPHYDFIASIKRMKPDEIEIGWFNNRYIALIKSEQHGTLANELSQLLWGEYYTLEDDAKKDKPIHMIIDATKDIIDIKVKNINE